MNNLFTKIRDNKYDYAINVLSKTNTVAKRVNLGVDSKTAGNHTIALEKMIDTDNLQVYLIDNELNSRHNLSNSAYSYASNPVTNSTRFAVEFVPPVVASITDATLSGANIYTIEKTIYVNNAPGAIVQVQDMNGILVYNGKSGEINLATVSAGVYIVKVTGESNYTVKKVVLQ